METQAAKGRTLVSPPGFLAARLPLAHPAATSPRRLPAPSRSPQTRVRGSRRFRAKTASCRTASTRHHCSKDSPLPARTRVRDVNAFSFTGREFNQATGLQYNRARWYGQEMGRFAALDPLHILSQAPSSTEPPSYIANWLRKSLVPPVSPLYSGYAYVGNIPTSFIDPTGLFRKKCNIQTRDPIWCKHPLPWQCNGEPAFQRVEGQQCHYLCEDWLARGADRTVCPGKCDDVVYEDFWF
jgi:RHS repeat-associated protein